MPERGGRTIATELAAGPSSLLLTVTATETVVSIDGVRRAEHAHRGPTSAIQEQAWRLERARTGRRTFSRVDPGTGRTVSPADAARHAVIALGSALGEEFLGGPVGDVVIGALRDVSPGTPLRLGVRVTAADLAALPWEAALPPGQAESLALSPAAQVYRSVRRHTVTAEVPPEPPGRLRFLGAFADPVRGPVADGPVLDLEADLHRILGAVEPGLRAGTVEFDVLDGVDTLASITRMLRRQTYDVLHLSCHARAGRLLLEDGRGYADPVTADRLISAFSPGRVPSLVVLAGCSTGADPDRGGGPGSSAPDERLAGLAAELVAAGVPAVLAMTAPVSDAYAGSFCAEVYEGLGRRDGDTTERPDVPDFLYAVSEARRRLEHLARAEPGGLPDLSEWSTPALFTGAGRLPVRSRRTPRPGTSVPPPRPAAVDVRSVVRRGVLRELHRLWESPDRPGLLVHGAAGVGKTTLVREFVSRLGSRNDMHVWIDGSDDDALEEMLRMPAPTGPGGTSVPVVVDALPTRPVPGRVGAQPTSARAARLLADWTRRAEAPRLIVIGRHAFSLPEEARRALAPVHLGGLTAGETRLLAGRLPGLRRLPVAAIARILDEIGGNPAALGWLDALLRGEPPILPDLRQRLAERLAAEGLTAAEARARGLGAALRTTRALLAEATGLEELLDGLTARQRDVLTRLSVHRRPVGGEALGPVTADVRDALAALDARGLLRRAPAQAGPGSAYLVERWLAVQLSQADPVTCVDAHAAAGRHWARLPRGPEETEAASADLAEARHHYLRAGRTEEALLTTAALCDRLMTAGAFSEVERIVRDTLARGLPGDHESALLHHAWGCAAQETGRTDEARSRQERALELFRAAGAPGDAASVELQLGMLDEAVGNYTAARERYTSALTVFTELGDHAEISRARHCLGGLAVLLRDTKAARAHYDAALASDRERGDDEGIAATIHQLGIVDQLSGDPRAARKLYRRALTLHRKLGDRAAISSGYHQLAMLAYEQGELRRASSLCRRSLGIDDESAHLPGVARSEHLLGMIAHDREERDQARLHYERALALLTAAGDRASAGAVLHQLGLLAQDQGDSDRAHDLYRRTLAAAGESGDRDGVARAHHQLAMLATQEGDYEEAERRLRLALEMFEDLGDPDGSARALGQLGRVRRLTGHPEEAVEPTLRSFALGLETDDPVATTALFELALLDEALGGARLRELIAGLVEPSHVDPVMEAVRAAREQADG